MNCFLNTLVSAGCKFCIIEPNESEALLDVREELTLRTSPGLETWKACQGLQLFEKRM